MDHDNDRGDDPMLSARLDVQLDRRPIIGRLRTRSGADESFVGWLGLAESLNRLHELRRPPECPNPTSPAQGGTDHA